MAIRYAWGTISLFQDMLVRTNSFAEQEYQTMYRAVPADRPLVRSVMPVSSLMILSLGEMF